MDNIRQKRPQWNSAVRFQGIHSFTTSLYDYFWVGPNPSSSQWANKTNTHKTNLNNSNMTNDENCLELPMNSEYHNAEKDLVGGKIANYNRSSGMLMDDLHTEAFSFKNKPSNESSINGINCNSTHNQINQRLEGNSSTPKYMFFCN